MAIPDYQSIMLPLLQFLKDGQEHSLREAYDSLSGHFSLSEEEQKELLPSGQQGIFHNRVGWARTYLKKSGLLTATRRGYFRIADLGLSTLGQNPERIDNHYLEQFQGFRDFKTAKREKESGQIDSDLSSTDRTPEEDLEGAYQSLRNDLASELLQLVKSNSPSQFEKMVIELLVKMGYGGSRKDAAQAIGRSGGEGIDGIIKEGRFGLVLLQVVECFSSVIFIDKPKVTNTPLGNGNRTAQTGYNQIRMRSPSLLPSF